MDNGKQSNPHKETASSDSTDLERYASNKTGSIADINLASIGLETEVERDISTLAVIGLGWNITNSWAGVAATMAFSIASGGSVTLIYGLLIIFILVGSSAATMAEISSVYPSAGGQYHWASILAPKRWSRGLSYGCGSINLLGWTATCAGVAIIPPQLIAGIIVFYDSSYTPKSWHIFLMFQAFNGIMLAYNILLMKRTAWIHDVGFAISLASCIAIFITSLACSDTKQSNQFVWKNFINSSGWSSDSIVFLTGLVNPNYIYAGLDGAIHLAEEVKNPTKAVPQALMSTVFIGFGTAFAFVVAMLYSLNDFDAVLATPTAVPIYEIWYQSTHSRAAATTFIALLASCGCFALIGCQQTASRLFWSFARDNAVIGSRFFSQIHPRFGVPVWALLANSAVVFIIGCVYLGSTTAFNAMIATGLILQQTSYAIPAALLMYRRRSSKYLRASRYFKLGYFGWVANALTVVMAVIATIFYNFPALMPVTSGSMNYACLVLGVMALFTIANWFGHAKKMYEGPRIPDDTFASNHF